LDDPIDFAKAVVQLYSDRELWNAISENGLRHIRELMSVESAAIKMEQILAN